MWDKIAERYIDILSNEHGDWKGKSPILLWNCYLILSYIYYEKDHSPVQDSKFDSLCVALKDIGKSGLKESGAWYVDGLYSEESLSAGTGYHLQGKYPLQIQNIANTMLNKIGYRILDENW